MDSFDRSDNNLEDYSPKIGLKNVREDIPVTFDSSSGKDLTDNIASDYDNPGLKIPCYAIVFSFEFLVPFVKFPC